MTTITCEQCKEQIELKPGAYRIVGIRRNGRAWPNVYVHQGACEVAWNEQNEPAPVEEVTQCES